MKKDIMTNVEEFDFEEYKKEAYERAQIILCAVVILSAFLAASMMIVVFSTLITLFN